jgi:glutaredoxin/glutathione-dependent peroxiredoxin
MITGATVLRPRRRSMPISVGDPIPDVTLRTLSANGPEAVQSTEALGKGKVVLFAVPGAFTPTCSDHHLPGFVLRADDIAAKGVDTIACIAVNDPFVMGAWGQAQDTGDKVVMLSDGNGDFTAAVGLELDGSGYGLGTRSQRYAAIIEDGVVTELMVEPNTGVDVSSADAVLSRL